MSRLTVLSLLVVLAGCDETATQPQLDVDPQFAVGGDMDMFRAAWKGIPLCYWPTCLELSFTAVGSMTGANGVIVYSLTTQGKHRTLKVDGVTVQVRPDGTVAVKVTAEDAEILYDENFVSADPTRWTASVCIRYFCTGFMGPDALRLHDGIQVLRDGLDQEGGAGGGF